MHTNMMKWEKLIYRNGMKNEKNVAVEVTKKNVHAVENQWEKNGGIC